MNTGGQRYFLIGLLGVVFVASCLIIKPFFGPLTLAMVFAVVLQPLYIRVLAYCKGRESLSSLIVVAIVIVCLLVPAFFIGAQIAKEGSGLYTAASTGQAQPILENFLNNSASFADRYVPGAGARIRSHAVGIDGYAATAITWIAQHFGAAFSSAAAVLLALFIFFISLYYLLRDGSRLMREIIRLSPLKDRDDKAIIAKLELAVNSVVKGKLAIALIQGIFAGIGFFLFGVPNPVLWGLIAVFAALIPPLGTALVAIPAILYLAAFSGLAPAAGLLIWSAVAGIVDNVVGPQIMGRGTSLHPLLVLLSVLGGLAFFGPVGVFLGPLTVSLLLALLSIYESLEETGSAQNAA